MASVGGAEAATAEGPAAAVHSEEHCMWPLSRLLLRLEQAGSGKKPAKGYAVLLTTGAMNPPHRGHVQLLHQAAARVEASGFGVLGAWLSPSHDAYVQPKAKSLLTAGFSAPFRLEVARKLVAEDDLVAVGAWESQPERGCWPDFPVVTRALQEELNMMPECDRLKGSHGYVQVFYCCGTDHADKCGLYFGMGAERGVGVVVVPRTGETAKAERPERLVFVAKPSADAAAFSSTKLRNALAKRDFEEVVAATSLSAAKLLLQPTPQQETTFTTDYTQLPAKPAGTKI